MKNTVGTLNSKSRRAWLSDKLNAIPLGKTIIDVGAGQGQYRDLCSHLNYTSQDFCQYDGQGDQRGLQKGQWETSEIDVESDITSIPVPENSFDVVMCNEVLEHVPNPILALQEMTRILKTNGDLILTAPFCSLTHFAPHYYFTGFSRYFFEKHLDDHFKIVEIQPNGNFYEWLGQEIRRIEFVRNKYGNKKTGILFKLARLAVLYFLNRYSRHDSNSSELLCFGLHIHAKKIR